MLEVDPALAIQAVEAAHHVVRLAGPLHEAGSGDYARPVSAGDKRRHGPEPRLLGAAEGLGLGGAREAGAYPGRAAIVMQYGPLE